MTIRSALGVVKKQFFAVTLVTGFAVCIGLSAGPLLAGESQEDCIDYICSQGADCLKVTTGQCNACSDLHRCSFVPV
jgi:hypothetical protein